MTENDFENITRSLRPRLLKMAWSFLSCKEAAEDVTQETLLRLWIMRRRYRTADEANSLATAVAKNLCVDIWRKKQKMKHEDIERIADNVCETQPEDGPDDNDRQRLNNAMAGMTARDRRMIRMRYEGGMSIGQIAAAIGIAPASVALCRAKKRLLDNLGGEDYGR